MRARAALCVVALAACRASPPPSAAGHAQPLLVADAGKPRADCYACHARDYASAHRHEGVKPTRCAVCHLESGWHPTQRNHPWPLTGAHQPTDCLQCHSGKPPLFEDLPSACVDCHRADYDKSEYPGHDRFALTCADCHSTTAWKPAQKPGQAGANGSGDATHAGREPGKPTRNEASAAPARAKPTRSAPRTSQVEAAAPEAPLVSPPPTAAGPRQHPESAFPITTGNHTDIECATCHDGPGGNGKDNTDCVQCHERSRFDRRHTQVANYPSGDAPANFCVECHTRGTRATRSERSGE